MNEFYAEWLDSSLFALEEAMGMAAECGYAADLEALEGAYDAITACADEGAYTLTAKGQTYLNRQRSIKRGREAKRAYDRAYSMVRSAQNPYKESLDKSWWRLSDAAHVSYKNTYTDDLLANTQRRLLTAYLERGMNVHYQLSRCNYYAVKTGDDSYIKRNRTIQTILRSLRDG